MNNENYHPILKEAPIAHALHKWDNNTRILSYEYNGRNIISIHIPGTEEVGFRHGSDGNVQNIPFIQQIYVMLDGLNKCIKSKVTFNLSNDALNMRPRRAGSEQAILGQVGRPLMYGVNGIYDITQDLLIDWNGCSWEWLGTSFVLNEKGDLTAEMEVELSSKPFTINLRMHYYRTHLGYSYYKPWEWRPNTRPVAGWCSWEACRRHVSMNDIEKFSEFFSNTLKDYGLEYIQLDDGYEKYPIPSNADKTLAEGWLETNERFPRGHKEVIEKIGATGMEPAIWTNANVTNKDFAYKNRECFIENQNGELMLGEWIDYLLDCSDKTLQKHVYPYYKKLSEMGYTYFKTDAIRHLIMDGLHEAVRQGLMINSDAQARFRKFMEYARKGIGEDKYFLASWGVLSEAVGLVDACRIAMDANPTWAGIRMQMVESARWFHTQRILFLNDPDHICVRTNIGWLKSVISLISLSGSLLMLSDPLVDYTEDRLEIIKKSMPTLAAYTGETGPVDMTYPAFTWTKLHGFAVNSKEKPVEAEDVLLKDALDMAGIYSTMDDMHPFSTLWSFHIDTTSRKWCVVGRFATVPLKESKVAIESLGLDPTHEYTAFDFWAQEYLGRVSGHLKCKELDLGSCQIIALCPVQEHPQLIASSRHVSMDAVSVKSQLWKNNELIVNIKGVPGTVEYYWFHVPAKYVVESVWEGDHIVSSPNNEVVKVRLAFSASDTVLKIKFKYSL